MKKQIILIGFLAALLFSISSPCKAVQDYFQDTVWVKKTDQISGFYQCKMSNTDSMIVAHGYAIAYVYKTLSGEQIARLPFNGEVHFFNQDKNIIQLAPSRDRLIVFETKEFKAIDTLEYDTLSIGDIVISNDEKKVIGIISNGLRVWDLEKHNIIMTKLYKTEEYQTSLQAGQISITNDNSKFIVTERREFYNPNISNSTYFSLRHNIYNVLAIDSIDTFVDKAAYRLSNSNKYIAFRRSSKDYGVEIYDFSTKELVQTLQINGYNLTGIEFSPDDKYIITSSGVNVNKLFVWNIETGTIIYEYYDGSYENLDITKDGKYFVSSIGEHLLLYFAKYGGTIVPEKEEITKIIYPNPATGNATIEFEQNNYGITTIELLNLEGKRLKTILNKYLEEGNHKIEINASEIPSGKYYIIVQNEKDRGVLQLVVEH